MKMRFALVFSLLVGLVSLPLGAIEIAEKMYLKEKIVAATMTFNLCTDDEELGVIHRKFLTLTKQYHLKDTNGELVSKATARVWGPGLVFDIEDAHGELLGHVKERIINVLPTFDLLSPQGEKLAKAKLNFWETTFTIKDYIDGHKLVTIKRPQFHFVNNWTLTVHDMVALKAKNIDLHMLLVIAACQADQDTWKNKQTKCAHAPFIQQTYPERSQLQQIIPSAQDFEYIEKLKGDDALWLLESEQLTLSQKAALLRLVDKSLEAAQLDT